MKFCNGHLTREILSSTKSVTRAYKKLNQLVYESTSLEVSEGKVPPGTRLTTRVVSRTPPTEKDGLVEPGGSTFHSSFSHSPKLY